MTALTEGKKAPAFSLKDQHGKTVKLGDIDAERIVLYFSTAGTAT